MKKIFIPSSGPDDWQCLLADPEKHWARGYSARTLAHCWEDADGFPREISNVLSQDSSLASAKPILIFPEWRVPLPGGSRPSQNDIWILASSNQILISITVEGKVNESFDITIGEWNVNASPGKKSRLSFILNKIGLSVVPDHIHYQLLHRTASAVIEAKRFHATHAIMLVHSFSPTNECFEDFASFVSLYGPNITIGQLVKVTTIEGISLHLAWVNGNEKFLVR